MLNPHIFRAYDVRGRVGSDINPDVFQQIGRAYGTLIHRNGGRTIAIGQDNRESSAGLKAAFTEGVRAAGGDVVDVGEVTTPMLYFATAHWKLDGGATVTGSHNPVTDNGVKMVHAPYKGGPLALNDLIAGHIQLIIEVSPVVNEQVVAGTIKGFAVTSPYRQPNLPNVPTFAEAGVPGIVIDSWFGFLAPAATPPAVVAALNAAFNKALADPAVRKRMEEVGVIPLGGTPERMGEHMRSEVARWGAVIRENNIRAQ